MPTHDEWDPFSPELTSEPFSYGKFYGKLGDLDHARTARYGNNSHQTIKVPTKLDMLMKEIVASSPIYNSIGDFLRDSAVKNAHMLKDQDNMPMELQLKLREFESAAKAAAFLSDQEYYQNMYESWDRTIKNAPDDSAKEKVRAELRSVLQDILDPYWSNRLGNLC